MQGRRVRRRCCRYQRRTLGAVLLLALGIRVWVAVTQVYEVHQDEVFQYLEQAHRLAFGSGVVPWEYHDGIRSWLLPGVLGGIMWICAWLSPDPSFYLRAIGAIASLSSLTVVYIGFRPALRREGNGAALMTGVLCAIWFECIFFAPSIMTEALSTYCAFAAVYLAETRDESESRVGMAGAGLLLGLAACLRFQLSPALLTIALWHCRLDWRRRGVPLLTGGLCVVIPVLGVLDFLTWGSPFQSIWMNFTRNVIDGVSTSAGADPPLLYVGLIHYYWTPAALVLLVLLPLGATRAPLLATAAAIMLLSHSLIGHKEYRYISFATMAAPILIGLGAARVFAWLDPVLRKSGSVAVRAAFLLYAGLACVFAWTHGGIRAQRDEAAGTLQAFLAAHRQPGLCGLGVVDVGWTETGGYVYLHRDVPLYYFVFRYPTEAVKKLNRIGVDLKLDVMFRGAPLRQFDGQSPERFQRFYNFVIAPPARALPGYRPVQCFANGSTSFWPVVCLERRDGGCDPP